MKVLGTDFASKSCTPCEIGYSLPGSDDCSQCMQNEYLDIGEDEQKCKLCPANHTSPPGSVGIERG